MQSCCCAPVWCDATWFMCACGPVCGLPAVNWRIIVTVRCASYVEMIVVIACMWFL
uniref:Uncharacterized protein n=1 Tax=Arundo donax TaxID=35708 RepID=A0A0A9F0M7_ARUDO